jgi:molybdenum cofactor synthesis domain-containing protein
MRSKTRAPFAFTFRSLLRRYNGQMSRAVVITVSDSRSAGKQADLSGPAVARVLAQAGFNIVDMVTIPDDQPLIEAELRRQCACAHLVVTTGGTGISPRDVTPEATRAVCDRLLDGVAEQMRTAGLKETPFASLSRAVCGTCGETLVLNLPGSPKGAVTSLQAVLHLLPHALSVLEGTAVHTETAGA